MVHAAASFARHGVFHDGFEVGRLRCHDVLAVRSLLEAFDHGRGNSGEFFRGELHGRYIVVQIRGELRLESRQLLHLFLHKGQLIIGQLEAVVFELAEGLGKEALLGKCPRLIGRARIAYGFIQILAGEH